METTATFDHKTDEFIINTPHVGASKWWIGGAAHTATHCLVYARLIIDGKDYGVKQFVTPMRSVDDWSLLPGISCGDIGKKMGRDAIDNGWIQFSNVRIPRVNMLMRYAKVDRDGNVTQPPLAQLAYGALVTGRVSMAGDSFHYSKRFLTIAIRYAAIRRQFSATPGKPETKILDYTYHQRRLMPRLAYSYAMRAGTEILFDVYWQTQDRLEAAATSSNKADLEDALLDIKEVFALSAGLKASCTWGTAQIIEECRQACGGHGYSGYNGFGQGYADWVVQCTWEGDNNVLMLSTGRALIQSCLNARNGKNIGSAVSYLGRYKELENVQLNGRDIRDPAVIVEAWESVTARAINHAADAYVNLTKEKGLNQTQAFEELSQHRFEIARLHTRLFLIKSFYDKIRKSADPALKDVLYEVATLFGLWSIECDDTVFLRFNYMAASDLDAVTSHVNEYCLRVRKNAIGLTDAFNLSDFYINSPIGNYDGDAYKHYFTKVNRQNNPRNTHPPYYKRTMEPYFQREETEHPDISEMDTD
jgi:acyl-CoA oxidase